MYKKIQVVVMAMVSVLLFFGGFQLVDWGHVPMALFLTMLSVVCFEDALELQYMLRLAEARAYDREQRKLILLMRKPRTFVARRWVNPNRQQMA